MDKILELDKYIQDLLYDYDCVILPQLGGFVTNYRPAVIDTDAGIAHPPGKDILFNKNLTKSDGLLERAIADEADLSFEDAGVMLREVVSSYWSKLNGGEKIKFNRIGVLYIDDHKNLRFKPAANENFLKSSFGLESFALPPKVEIPVAEEIHISTEHTEVQTSTAKVLKPRRRIYWVAAATLLPFVAMSLYLGFTTGFKSPTEITFAELIPFKTSKVEERKYAPRTPIEDVHSKESTASIIHFPEALEVFPFSFEKNEVDSNGVWIKLEETTPAETKLEKSVHLERKESKATPSRHSNAAGIYHIIAGCFGEEKNAQKFVNQLRDRDYDASILDYHKGLHRVRVESFNDFTSAVSTLESLREGGTFPNAWLLKKPVSQ